MVLERLKLDGKVAIVTGGGMGVGRGIAQVLAEAGAAVVVTARSADGIKQTAADIESQGGRALAIQADATKREDNERVVAAAIEKFGRIDILVNNVGGSGGGLKPFAEVSEADLLHDFQLNVVSAFTLSQLCAPHMRQSGSGSIVNISSRAASFVGKGRIQYGVAKAALEQLTRLLAQELGPEIRVNAIALGTIMTPALERSIERDNGPMGEALYKSNPLKKIGNVGDIGLAALYYCASDCYANGAVLHVDGGLPTTPSNMMVMPAKA